MRRKPPTSHDRTCKNNAGLVLQTPLETDLKGRRRKSSRCRRSAGFTPTAERRLLEAPHLMFGEMPLAS